MPSPNQVATRPTLPAIQANEEGFSLHDLRVFRSIPEHGHDVVALRGEVIVYDTDAHQHGEIEDGGFYVVERQRPRSNMPWANWLNLELRDAAGRGGPFSQLVTSREVIQAVRLKRGSNEERWFYRLAGGFCDGPLYDWAVGMDFIGKVVGIYRPGPDG